MTNNPISVFDLTIQDVNGPKYFSPDVVPTVVSDAYNAQVNNILTVYNDYIQGQVTDPTTGAVTPFQLSSSDPTTTQTVFSQLLAAKDALINLATNGLPLVGGGTGYLNQTMARSLNTLFQTLDLAGITDANANASPDTQLAALQNWLDLSTAGLGNVLAQAGQAGQSGRSIQAMIELEYIQAGNNLISNKLGGLESALGYTQQAVNILTTLQNIMNKVAPSNVASTLNNFLGTLNANGDANAYVQGYQSLGGAAYNSPIGAVPNGVTGTDVANFQMYSSYTGPLHALISALLQVANPPWTQGVDVDSGRGDSGAFNSLTGAMNPNASYLAGTLVANLYQVYYDMRYPTGSTINSRTGFPANTFSSPWQGIPTSPLGPFSPLSNLQNQAGYINDPTGRLDIWLVDNMGNAQKQGLFSNDMTTAQTSAESLNSAQSQQIQQTLFLFQEFYQSGSGMLTQINQIIQAMAQGSGQ